MNRTELVKKMTSKADLPFSEGEMLLEIFFRKVSNEAASGEQLFLPDVGSFSVEKGKDDLTTFHFSDPQRLKINIGTENNLRSYSRFNISLGKPVFPLKGKSEAYLRFHPDENLNTIESKADKLFSIIEKVLSREDITEEISTELSGTSPLAGDYAENVNISFSEEFLEVVEKPESETLLSVQEPDIIDKDNADEDDFDFKSLLAENFTDENIKPDGEQDKIIPAADIQEPEVRESDSEELVGELSDTTLEEISEISFEEEIFSEDTETEEEFFRKLEESENETMLPTQISEVITDDLEETSFDEIVDVSYNDYEESEVENIDVSNSEITVEHINNTLELIQDSNEFEILKEENFIVSEDLYTPPVELSETEIEHLITIEDSQETENVISEEFSEQDIIKSDKPGIFDSMNSEEVITDQESITPDSISDSEKFLNSILNESDLSDVETEIIQQDFIVSEKTETDFINPEIAETDSSISTENEEYDFSISAENQESDLNIPDEDAFTFQSLTNQVIPEPEIIISDEIIDTVLNTELEGSSVQDEYEIFTGDLAAEYVTKDLPLDEEVPGNRYETEISDLLNDATEFQDIIESSADDTESTFGDLVKFDTVTAEESEGENKKPDFISENFSPDVSDKEINTSKKNRFSGRVSAC
jgi:hypothetical protein